MNRSQSLIRLVIFSLSNDHQNKDDEEEQVDNTVSEEFVILLILLFWISCEPLFPFLKFFSSTLLYFKFRITEILLKLLSSTSVSSFYVVKEMSPKLVPIVRTGSSEWNLIFHLLLLFILLFWFLLDSQIFSLHFIEWENTVRRFLFCPLAAD